LAFTTSDQETEWVFVTAVEPHGAWKTGDHDGEYGIVATADWAMLNPDTFWWPFTLTFSHSASLLYHTLQGSSAPFLSVMCRLGHTQRQTQCLAMSVLGRTFRNSQNCWKLIILVLV